MRVGLSGCLGALLLTWSMTAVVGCSATKDQLLKRAAFDLGCTKDEMRVTRIDQRTRGVRGCGKQATYIESCDSARASCTWVLNERRQEDDE
jgi:hypothetical protein